MSSDVSTEAMNFWIILSAILFFLIVTIIVSIYKQKKTGKSFFSIQKLGLIGLMSALVVISGFLTFSIPPGISIGVEEVFLLLSGYLLGPIGGLIVALISDWLVQGILLGAIASRHITYFLVAPIAVLLGSLLKNLVTNFKVTKHNSSIAISSFMFLLIIIGILIVTLGLANDYTLEEKIIYPIFVILFGVSFFWLCYWVNKNDRKNINFLFIIFGIVLIEKIINSWFLGTINSTLFWGAPLDAAFTSKIISTPLIVPFTTTILFIVLTKIKMPLNFTDNKRIKW